MDSEIHDGGLITWRLPIVLLCSIVAFTAVNYVEDKYIQILLVSLILLTEVYILFIRRWT